MVITQGYKDLEGIACSSQALSELWQITKPLDAQVLQHWHHTLPHSVTVRAEIKDMRYLDITVRATKCIPL